MSKINVKLYEVDDVLFAKQVVDKPVQTWLIAANDTFFRDEVEKIHTEGFSTVILANGSYRQDKNTDLMLSLLMDFSTPAAIPTHLLVLPLLQLYFSQSTACHTLIELLFMPDIYNGLAAGTTFKAGLQARYNQSLSAPPFSWVKDPTKITLIYAYAQATASLHQHDEIIIDCVDKADKLRLALQFYQSLDDFLPCNVKLRFWAWEHGTTSLLAPEVVGTGSLDEHYQWSIRYIASQLDREIDPTKNRLIDSAEELAHYHRYQAFASPSRQQKMDLRLATLDAPEFRNFRQVHLPKLEKCHAEHISGYTQTQRLLDEGLLPLDIQPSQERKPDTFHSTASIWESISLKETILASPEMQNHFVLEFHRGEPPRSMTSLRPPQSQPEKIVPNYLEMYLNPHSGYTIETYINKIRQLNGEENTPLPTNFDAGIAINLIAHMKIWETAGTSLALPTLSWANWSLTPASKIPDSVNEIKGKNIRDLPTQAKVITLKLAKSAKYVLPAMRGNMTYDFYQLILALREVSSRMVQYLAIQAFCKKYAANEVLVEEEGKALMHPPKPL